MQVVEVDAVDAKAAEAGLAAGAHVLGPAADGPGAAGVVPRKPELGGHLHLLPRQLLELLPEQDLVGERPVDVGGVEEGDPATEGVRDDCGRRLVVERRRSVSAGEAEAPETQLGHLNLFVIATKPPRARREMKRRSWQWNYNDS